MNKTSLGSNEKLILDEIAPIIKKWSKKLGVPTDQIERNVSYLWKDYQEELDKAHDDWLSANEIGPYGGR